MILDKKIEVFLAVADAGSFSTASRQLSLSQSVVSFHIGSLEDELGVELFKRRGRTITLTDEGRYLYEELKTISRTTKKLTDAFAEHSERIKESIHLAGDAHTCAFTLPWTLSAFREDYPDVSFTYKHLHHETLITELLSDEIDIGLVGYPIRNKNLEMSECFQDEIALISHPEMMRDKLKVEGLKEIPLLWMNGDRGLDLTIKNGLSKMGIKMKDLNIFMEVSDLQIAKTFILARVGVAFLSLLTVERELEEGLMKIVDVEELALSRTNYIIFKKEKSPRKVVVRFLKFVEERSWQDLKKNSENVL